MTSMRHGWRAESKGSKAMYFAPTSRAGASHVTRKSAGLKIDSLHSLAVVSHVSRAGAIAALELATDPEQDALAMTIVRRLQRWPCGI
jgi:hypothetical protein